MASNPAEFSLQPLILIPPSCVITLVLRMSLKTGATQYRPLVETTQYSHCCIPAKKANMKLGLHERRGYPDTRYKETAANGSGKLNSQVMSGWLWADKRLSWSPWGRDQSWCSYYCVTVNTHTRLSRFKSVFDPQKFQWILRLSSALDSQRQPGFLYSLRHSLYQCNYIHL